MFAGDVNVSLAQHPELSDGEGDPLDYQCDVCGADAGEECHPYCTATPQPQRPGDEGDEGDENT